MSVTICITFVRNCVMEATTMIAASLVGFCVCSTFCHFMVFLVWQLSSWGGEERVRCLRCLSSCCVVIIVLLFLTVPWVDLQFVIVVFPDHTHLFLFHQ